MFLHTLISVIITLSVKRASCASLKQHFADRGQESVEVKEIKVKDLNRLQFEFYAFGEDWKLVLSKNGQLAIPQAQVIRRHNGRTVSRDNLGDQGYYTGYIQSRPGSRLALKIDNGSLSGVIVTDHYLMTIHRSEEGDGLRHVVTREKHEKNTLQHVDPSLLHDTSQQHFARTRRSTSSNRYVELMIVADRYTTEAYGNFTEQYIMSVAYLLSAVMQDDSIGDIKVIYVVVNIIIVSGYEKGLDINEKQIEGSVNYLSLFSTWVKQFNNPDENNPKHFDQAILITRKVCGLQTADCYENGRGYFGDMCSATRSVASAIAAGLSAGLTAAHETGHNFGLSHDSGACSNGYIMNTALASGGNAFSWSSCSRSKLQTTFADRKKFSCLNDIPPGFDTSAAASDVSVLNLAKNYSGDEQCRLMYGDSYAHCGPLKSNCKTLYCGKIGENFCQHRSTPPLEGTECGTYKWCRNGACVAQPIPDPIDGQWSSWSKDFSGCTRTCGMGVRYRTRTCDNPKPEYFGKDCHGESKGQFETCNTQDCTPNTDSLRLQQCKEIKPSYSDYFDAHAPCLLRCTSGGKVSYYPNTVKDGTLCSKYKDERDICVLGECKKVYCDRTFDRKFYDRCRVCSGDGSTCRLVNSSYDTVLSGATPKYGEMFTLPVGSVNLLVEEKSVTYNNIGLQDQNGTWIIGENSASVIKYFAGARITYERPLSRSLSKEKLVLNGPTTEPLKVMFIYWYEVNAGVPYQYYEPLTTPDTTPLTFIWKHTLSDCSEACAGGVQTKITTCHRSDDDSEVGLKYCDAKTEPTGTVACNTQACQPSWQTDDWSACSATCGPNGTRSRTVECRQKLSADVTTVLSDDQCPGTKPSGSEVCNRKDCPAEWVPGEWSACSKNKCEGIQSRTSTCKQLLVTGVTRDLETSKCPSETPLNELICNAGIHCYEWRPVYPNCTECQEYYTDTDGSKYKPVGCYKMKSKPFGSMLTKLALNTNKKSETVAQCGQVAWERARRMFAVGGQGECYGSMDAHRVFYKDGVADDCVDDVIGGTDSVYVYALTGKVLLSTPTCYSVEDEVTAQSASCEALSAKPRPEIKVCCEEMCKDRCQKTTTGTYCSLPFIYKGKTYYECTPNPGNGRMWCATTSNFDIDRHGADCEEPCRHRTTSGECCSFPFIYRGRLFNTCTTVGSTHAWCALTSNYDRDRIRGRCM